MRSTRDTNQSKLVGITPCVLNSLLVCPPTKGSDGQDCMRLQYYLCRGSHPKLLEQVLEVTTPTVKHASDVMVALHSKTCQI